MRLALPILASHSAMLVEFDYSRLAAGAVSLLPLGMTFTRADASTVATVQTSESTVVSGIAANVARVGRLAAAHALGLLVEETRQNDMTSHHPGSGWSPSNSTLSTVAGGGPDGGACGRVDDASASQFGYAIITIAKTNSVAYANSFYARSQAGSDGTQFGANWNDILVNPRITRPAASWARTISTGTSSASSPVNQVLYAATTATSSVGTVDYWGVQCERGAFATSAILTTGAAATRAGDRLRVLASRAVANGRIAHLSRFRPLAARSAYSGTPYVFANGATDYASFNPADGKVTIVTAGGASYTTANGATWAAGDTIDLWIEAGGGVLQSVVKYRVNGGATSTLGTSPSPQAALGATPSTMLDLHQSAAANQLSAWFERDSFSKPGSRPTWAA